VHPTYGRGLFLLWRLCETLCRPTFGFVDDVVFVRHWTGKTTLVGGLLKITDQGSAADRERSVMSRIHCYTEYKNDTLLACHNFNMGSQHQPILTTLAEMSLRKYNGVSNRAIYFLQSPSQLFGTIY